MASSLAYKGSFDVRQIAACDNLPHPSNAATLVVLNLQTRIQDFKPGGRANMDSLYLLNVLSKITR
jgi:hypothetical protein